MAHPNVDDLPVLVENVFQVVLVGGGVHVSAENVRCAVEGRGERSGGGSGEGSKDRPFVSARENNKNNTRTTTLSPFCISLTVVVVATIYERGVSDLLIAAS